MSKEKTNQKILKPWQNKMHEIIYEAHTPAGKLFDIVLLVMILLSVAAVMLESVPTVNVKYGDELIIIEWCITFLFTLEYIARLMCIQKPIRYILSFYGIVDLLSILPSYLGLFVTEAHSLTIIRTLRLLRVFRILKLMRFVKETNLLIKSLRASLPKITVFVFFVLCLTFILGTVMYIVEGPESGFKSIPISIYWAIVTLTTVGYGDIAPITPLGQFIASIIMLTGYAIIAVPTGIVSVEIAKQEISKKIFTRTCTSCTKEGHDSDALFCKDCGASLD
jgi:voltage-gated potassium channel